MVDRCFSQDVRVDSARLEFKTAEGVRAFLATSQVVGDAPHQEGGIITLRDYGRMREIQNLLDHARILSRLAKMAAGVAHEVRNPLNAMNIHLELLAQGTASSGNSGSNRNHLEIVRREIGRLERVVYGFLKLARLQDLNLTRIDIASFLGELRTLVLPEARMAGLDIVLDLNPQLPEVYGDEEVLRQALLNLLKNAIQASPPGSLPIKVSARPDGALVCLVIEDHGRGMTPEVQAKAFDIYFTTKKDGTGVGLSLVQQAVEMHGGSIDVQSDPDRGATFTVRLPALALS
jgi:signal transduction histidine kinase